MQTFLDVSVEAKQAAVQATDKLMNNIVVEKVKDSFHALDEATRNMLTTVKGKLEEWAKLQIEQNIRKLLRKTPDVIKENIKDPHMCVCVKDMVDDLVEDIWPEVENEIMFSLRFSIDCMEKYEMPEEAPSCCLFRCLWWFVAWYRYTTRPVDKTIWQRLRGFSFWLLLIISLCPFYCVTPGLLLIDFLMIDKGDEYQLVSFILGFKTFQFASFGIIRGVVGFTQYYVCANYGNYSNNYTE